MFGHKASPGTFHGFIQTLIPVRFATKRVSGSKTNMRDSAGRRLGPKVLEGHFIKAGQIIMRQRGTKIHPGENTGIGRDHSIYATEPGWVKFYLDPFHPNRKFVGVSLRENFPLPSDHFSPRVRRFGHELIENPAKAKKELERQSRKEWKASYEIALAEAQRKDARNDKVAEFTQVVGEAKAADRLTTVYELTLTGMKLEDAQIQATYEALFDLKNDLKAGRIDQDTYNTEKKEILTLAQQVDSKWAIDIPSGKICDAMTPESREAKQDEIKAQLKDKYTNVVIKAEDKKAILDLIKTPGIFSLEQQKELIRQYLPPVLPTSVPGTVVENVDPSKPPKGVIISRIFDVNTGKVQVFARTKDAFIPQDDLNL